MKINILECVERTVRASHDGTEIIRIFYVDPYQAHPYVLAALLGGIEDKKRRKPSRDSYFRDCFCTDAWVDQIAKDAMSGSDQLCALRPPKEDSTVSQLADYLNYTQEVPRGTGDIVRPSGAISNAGCFIRAIYKPLVCENPQWTPSIGYTPDEFDFVDPQLHPITKTVSAGLGLKYLVDKPGSFTYSSVGSEGFVTQPMSQFSIRRIMCPSVPVQTISTMKGKINAGRFSVGQFKFPDQTLRFDECEVMKRAVPSFDGSLSVWYDLLYVFTFNEIFEQYWDQGPGLEDPGYVGWNRIFGCPLDFAGLPLIMGKDQNGATHQFPASYYPVGWKKSLQGEYRGLYLLAGMDDLNGIMKKGFTELFNPNAL